jgi:hypothetical protein
VDLKVGLVAGLRQRLQKVLPVHVIVEDVLAAVAPAHDMIDGTGIFDSNLPWHEQWEYRCWRNGAIL